MPDTRWSWFNSTMQMEPTESTAKLPAFMMQAMIYERGYPTLGGDTKSDLPNGYVPFTQKVKFLRKAATWEEPPLCRNGMPSEVAWRMLSTRPCSVPSFGESSALSPTGASWYDIVQIEVAEHSVLFWELASERISHALSSF